MPVDEALSMAAKVGVTKVVQIGCDLPSARWTAAFVEGRDDVIAGIGIHPNDAPREGDNLIAALDEIRSLASGDRIRAIGETGLDYFRTGEDGREVQEFAFRQHIKMARELDKTLVIHDRDAHDDVLRILEDEGAPERVVFHCFSGDAAMAQYCSERGWYVSFAGVVTFASSDELRAALKVVPDHLMLIETDAPYLTPVPHRGNTNGSYLIPFTARCMADVRDVPLEVLCNQLWDNAFSAFGEF